MYTPRHTMPSRRTSDGRTCLHAGYMTIALMLTGKFVFEYLGWGTAALATPVIMFFSGIAFFGLSLAAMYLGVDASAALLTGGAIAGALTQVRGRARAWRLLWPPSLRALSRHATVCTGNTCHLLSALHRDAELLAWMWMCSSCRQGTEMQRHSERFA